jgi:hypothetical protein
VQHGWRRSREWVVVIGVGFVVDGRGFGASARRAIRRTASPQWPVFHVVGFIPTSFEFLTSGGRERQRVGFRLSSKYHETSVLRLSWVHEFGLMVPPVFSTGLIALFEIHDHALRRRSLWQAPLSGVGR